MKPKTSGAFMTKRALIDKANTTMLIAAGIAAFLVVFSMVSAKALISQVMYQNRVIDAKQETLDTIQKNLEARDSLSKSYGTFVNNSTNLIGGSSVGTGGQDGNNSRIVLDALPSKYDFPALTASLEKLVGGQGMRLNSITGVDDEVAQSSQKTSATPKEVALDFQVKVDGSYAQLKSLVGSFERSIRPIKILGVTITSTNEGLDADIAAQTYYQPEKTLELTQKEIK